MRKIHDCPWTLALHRAIAMSGTLIGLATHLSGNPNRLPESLYSKALAPAPFFLVRRASHRSLCVDVKLVGKNGYSQG